MAEAVDSVREADGISTEVIIVDDGSTDAFTLEQIAKLELEGTTVIRQTNRGLGAARNAGIRAAQGEYVIPLDSDNRLRRAYFESGVRALNDNPGLGVVYADAEYFGEKQGRWRVGNFDLGELVYCNFMDACALIRKSVWLEAGGYDERMPWMGFEDWDLWLRVAFMGGRFHYLPEIGFDYRVRRDSMIAAANKHYDDLIRYMFAKSGLEFAKVLRDKMIELHQARGRLQQFSNSKDFRLGKLILDPPRRLRQTVRKFLR